MIKILLSMSSFAPSENGNRAEGGLDSNTSSGRPYEVLACVYQNGLPGAGRTDGGFQ